MEQDLIVIKQLPIIEDRLLAVKTSVEKRVMDAMSLVCTEENYKDVKKVRSELNKEYQELEKRRKEVKAGIMAPYEQFERVYKECAGDMYTKADATLKQKITEVEDGLKGQKSEALRDYFVEYRESLGLDPEFVDLSDMGVKVGLSDSLTGLKKKAVEFLDRVHSEIETINASEDKDEILTEYRKCFNLSEAMNIVNRRHAEIEAAKKAREEAEARRAAEKAREAEIASAMVEMSAQGIQDGALAAPVEMVVPAEVPAAEVDQEASQLFTTTFSVTGTLDQLRALKRFLEEGGYKYEC